MHVSFYAILCIYSIYRVWTNSLLLFLNCKSLWIKASAKWLKSKSKVNYSGYSDNSNTDRITVSFDRRRRRFEKIYVTQHSDQVNFDQNHTYRISLDLLKDIQELSLNKFLRETMNASYQISYQMHSISSSVCKEWTLPESRV